MEDLAASAGTSHACGPVLPCVFDDIQDARLEMIGLITNPLDSVEQLAQQEAFGACPSTTYVTRKDRPQLSGN